MLLLTITARDGTERTITASPGGRLMEAIRDAGAAEPFALCGGCCSCGTCHVYVDPAWFDRVGPANRDEEDVLGFSDHRGETSRLACQIRLEPGHDGLVARIAPED